MNATHALGWALVHFLWQGAVLAVLLSIALALTGPRAARTRYALALVRCRSHHHRRASAPSPVGGARSAPLQATLTAGRSHRRVVIPDESATSGCI
jgi:hypothetical protein